MKSKQLLIVSVLMVFCGINALFNESELDKRKRLQFLSEIDIDNDKGDNVFEYCEKNNSSDCQVLSTAIAQAKTHFRKIKNIKKVEKELSKSTDIYATTVLTDRLYKKQQKAPNYEKSFLDTLSPDQRKELDTSVLALLEQVSTQDILLQAKKITDVLSGVKD